MIKKETLLNYIFFLIAFFILIPNKLKEIPFVILGIFSIYFYFKGNKISIKEFLLITIFFSVNFFSLLYSDSLKNGFTRIEGFLPFLYITFSYLVILKMKIKMNEIFLNKWLLFFNISNLIFLILFSIYFFNQNLQLNYNNIRTNFDQMPLINMHPIYLSIMAVLGLMTSFIIINTNKLIGLFFIIINIILLLLSGAKATFIGFIVMLFLFILLSNMSKIYKFSIVVLSFTSIIVLFTFHKDFRERFRETILPISYKTVSPSNSTSVRYAIWNCSLQLIEESNLLFGNGIGDVKTILQNCYDSKYPKLGKYYNSHNQYFSIILGTGLLGLVSFFYFIFQLLKSGIKNKNKFIITLIIFYLYMFIFENVIERKYGILMFLFFSFFVFNLFQNKLAIESKCTKQF